jgi:hypothetical protein
MDTHRKDETKSCPSNLSCSPRGKGNDGRLKKDGVTKRYMGMAIKLNFSSLLEY